MSVSKGKKSKADSITATKPKPRKRNLTDNRIWIRTSLEVKHAYEGWAASKGCSVSALVGLILQEALYTGGKMDRPS